MQNGAASPTPDPNAPPGGIQTVMGRYVVGAHALTSAGATAEDARTLLQSSRGYFGLPADRVRFAIIAAELVGHDDALAELAALEKEHAEDPEQDLLTPELLADVAFLREVYSTGVADRSPAAHQDFVDRHEWFARLALADGLPKSDPSRAPLLAQAKRTAVVAIISFGGIAIAALLALVLGGVALALLLSGRIKRAYHPPTPGGSVYLEAVAVFLFGFIIISIIATILQATVGWGGEGVLIWLLPFACLWPIARGQSWAAHRYAIGWHRGRGVLREVGAGVVGYFAGLPIVAVGIGLTVLLMFIQGLFASPGESGPISHPVIDDIGKHGALGVLAVYLLASVWAPLTEESIFRGCLYHHLRGRLGPLLAGLAVALVFAVIHPQGWVALPALMSLALVFSLMREWRGSLIAPIVAHGMHNGALMTALILALS